MTAERRGSSWTSVVHEKYRQEMGEGERSSTPTRAAGARATPRALGGVGFDERGVDRLARANGSLSFDEGLAASGSGRTRTSRSACSCVSFSRERACRSQPWPARSSRSACTSWRAPVWRGSDGRVRARVALQPFEGLMIASDRSASREAVGSRRSTSGLQRAWSPRSRCGGLSLRRSTSVPAPACRRSSLRATANASSAST